MVWLQWVGILVCLLHSAMFSGLTIGLFGLSRLRLEVLAGSGSAEARRLLPLRKNANFLLATLLWGNVGVNVLLTLLTESVLSGIGAFVFSTMAIAGIGELMPQAYFTRNALTAGARLVPLVHWYGRLLYPVAKPTALLLDRWLGKEGVQFFREREFAVLFEHHAHAAESDIGRFEAQGALNFLALDDVRLADEGELVHPDSIISLPINDGLPVFPAAPISTDDAFLQHVNRSGKKWVILTNAEQHPVLVLDADQFLRDTAYQQDRVRPLDYCHRPIVVTEPQAKLGQIIGRFHVHAEHARDDVIDNDLILYWGERRRIITGSDILGRLLWGIVSTSDQAPSTRPVTIP